MGGLPCSKEIINAKVAARASGGSVVAEVARACNVMIAGGMLSEQEIRELHAIDEHYLAEGMPDDKYVSAVESVLGVST